MAKILEFRTPPAKPLTEEEISREILSPKRAVDLLILDMLSVAIPMWVEREWPFRQLELMANDLRSKMEEDVPPSITRRDIEELAAKMRPNWEEMIQKINTDLFW